MAKLMSKKTKEIVKTTTVLVFVVLIITFYGVYPLIMVPDIISRPEATGIDNPDSSLLNDPTIFIEAGLNPDTLTILTNDNIKLACLYFKPDSADFSPSKGTVILLHPDDTDRTAIIPYISSLLDSGLIVIAYDQRACGLSSGTYHFAGDYEADNLIDLIVYLNIHEMLTTPIIAVGFNLGADAVIGASREENRISEAIAVDPYLSSNRWIAKRKEKFGLLSIPLSNMIYYWWFQKITGYPFDRTFADDLQPIETKTTILMPDNEIEIEEVVKLKTISQPELLTILSISIDNNELQDAILLEIYSIFDLLKDQAE